MEYDVLIIGAGVSGSAIARELSKTNLKTIVLEKEEDVCEGTSKANSGIVHAGYDAKPGTLKAKLNVRGSQMIPELAKTLHFEYENNGSLVLCFEEAGRATIEELYERGQKNGVPGLRILEKEEILAMEPSINDSIVCALYAPTAGIVCPFGMNIAMAENAADNGVEFVFDTPVTSIEQDGDGWLVNGEYKTKMVVNAAGVFADDMHNLVSDEAMKITARKGEYFLLDHGAASICSHTLFQLPTVLGKGVLIAPTTHGNILVGPTATDIEEKDGTNTTSDGYDHIRNSAAITMKEIPYYQVITSFAGLRATPEHGDFVIEETAPGFIDVAGIESPGLSSAPAIGEMVAEMIVDELKPGKNERYVEERKGFVRPKDLDREAWSALIAQDPRYGTIICRCETVTEGEIVDACSRSIPARSLDGVKRRVRAGMGRCQGGFCSPKVMEIIAREENIPFDSIQKANQNSRIITGKDKEGATYER